MPARFVTVDHDTPLLLPPDLRDWVPANHLVHFVMDAVSNSGLEESPVASRAFSAYSNAPMQWSAACAVATA